MAASVPLRTTYPGPVPRTQGHLRLMRPEAVPSAPSVSVVIVNFCQWGNTTHLTRQLRDADSVTNGQAEVIIVDNHSPRSPHLKRLRRTPGVSLRRFGQNRGFARAVNEGCRLSRGDWFLLLNPDMSVPPGFLDRIREYAAEMERQAPDAGIIGFRLRHPDGSRQASCGPFPTLVNTLGGLLLPRRLRKCRPISQRRQRVPWVTGCCLLIRRECLESIGGFDEDFFLYYEDVDFCRRARKHGWSVWHDPRLELTHHSPLHLRKVVPALRLMTRHALLTYSGKHWPLWQTSLLSGVVWVEALLRERLARWRGQETDAAQYRELRAMAGDFIQGRSAEARKRLRQAANGLDRHSSEQDRIAE